MDATCPLLDWDREITLFINGSTNLLWDETIFIATQTWMWVPIGLVIIGLMWKHLNKVQFLWFLFFFALGIFLSDQLSSAIFKPYFQRFRPTNDPVYMFAVDAVHNYRGGSFGFFSAHASNTFTVAVLLCRLIRRPLTNVLILSWAVLNCYTRLYLGVHYFGDVVVGTCFGLLIGYTLSEIYRRRILHTTPAEEGVLSAKSAQILSCSLLASYCLNHLLAAASFFFPL